MSNPSLAESTGSAEPGVAKRLSFLDRYLLAHQGAAHQHR